MLFSLIGADPSWYLSRIYVEDLQTKSRYQFICEEWLAVEFGDGLIERTIQVSIPSEEKAFSHIFTTKMAEDFSDQHIWLSIFLKRPYDTFTRVQRTTCCFVLLLTTMLTSAMFYTLGDRTIYILRIGTLVIDYKGLIIGIQSSFIVLPINVALVFLFRNSKRKEEDMRKRKSSHIVQNNKKNNMSNMLNHRWLYVAWILSFLASAASIIVIIFYSMQWGNTKSKQWILSAITGFVQSAFVIQPIKLLAVTLVMTLIFKRGKEDDKLLHVYKRAPQENAIDTSQYGDQTPIFRSR